MGTCINNIYTILQHTPTYKGTIQQSNKPCNNQYYGYNMDIVVQKYFHKKNCFKWILLLFLTSLKNSTDLFCQI